MSALLLEIKLRGYRFYTGCAFSPPGLYVGMVFVSFQVTNYLFFHAVPKPSILLGGALILAGSAIVYGGRRISN
jgi:drug/metabolite transporter (DMT)-like permease